MYDVLVSQYDIIAWKNINTFSFIQISDIVKSDNRIRFSVKDNELICSFHFKTDKKRQIFFKYPVILEEEEKYLFNIFKYRKQKIPTWNDNNDIYQIIRQIKELFGLSNDFENEMFKFQRNIELINDRREILNEKGLSLK